MNLYRQIGGQMKKTYGYCRVSTREQNLDRLSRNKSHIKNELEYYKQRRIRVKILDIPTTLIDLPEEQDWIFDMINNILIEVLASIAEQERVRTL